MDEYEQHDLETVLASQLIRKPELIYSLDIPKENFRNIEAKMIIEGIRDFIVQDITYSPLELFKYTEGVSKERIKAVAAETSSSANFKETVAEIKTLIARDKLLILSDSIRDNIVSGDSPDMAISKIELYLSHMANNIQDDHSEDLLSVMTMAITNLEHKMENPGLPGVSTGYRMLDKMFGGFVAGRLYYIGARPSEGKTALMLNMYLSLLQSLTPAGIISIESTLKEIGNRMISIAGDLYAESVVLGEVKEDEIHDLRKSVKELLQIRSPLYHNPHASIDEIEVQVMRMVKTRAVKVVFVDYVQLISGGKFGKRNEEVAFVSRRLKAIALKANIAIVALAQMRREVDGRKAGMGDFAESSSLEKDADAMMAIVHRINDNGYEESKIAVLKSRDGRIGDCNVDFKRAKLIFKDLS